MVNAIPRSPITFPVSTPECFYFIIFFFTCVYSRCDAVVSPAFIAAATEAEIQKQTAATSNSRSPGNHKVITRELKWDAGLFDLLPVGRSRLIFSSRRRRIKNVCSVDEGDSA